MRILYVTNGFPFPLTSGFLRHYYLIRELSSRHAVSQLSVVGADLLPEHARMMEPFTERVLTFASSDRSRSLGRKAARRLRSLVTAGRGDPAAAGLGRAAAELLRTERLEAILFSGQRTYPALAWMPDLPVVADLCDAASQRIRGHV